VIRTESTGACWKIVFHKTIRAVYDLKNRKTCPGALHPSYCAPRLNEAIRKLQNSAHIEDSHGKYIDAPLIIAQFWCGQSLVASDKDYLNLFPK
jgi:hypothetical protein